MPRNTSPTKEVKEKNKKEKLKATEKSSHVTQQMCKNAAITTLATGESLAQYHRKRMAMSFKYDASEPPPKVPKRHSPSYPKCIPNPDALLHDIENLPPGEYINWGQVVKEFSQAHNVDTSKLEKAAKTSRELINYRLKYSPLSYARKDVGPTKWHA